MTADPKTSRYTNLVLKFRFKEKENIFYIPCFFLQDQSWLPQHIDRDVSSWLFSEQVGHVLIHYLYTGNYQPLKIENKKSAQSIVWAKFRIAVQVLLALGYWQLPKLQELVQSEIVSLGKAIHCYDAFYIVDGELDNATYDCKGDQEEWLINFLMTSLDVALENNSIDRADLSLFNKLHHIRLIKFFTTKFFESYISQISKTSEKVGQEPDVKSQDTDSVSAVTLTPNTLSSDGFEIKLEDKISVCEFDSSNSVIITPV